MSKLPRKNSSRPTFTEEKKLWEKGLQYVVGIDEVGRGAFAGPIVAAAVVFQKESSFKKTVLENINDSKLLSPKTRNSLAEEIKKQALCYSVAEVGVSSINKFGIGNANKMVFRKVVKEIIKVIIDSEKKSNIFVLVDGFHVKFIRNIGLKYQKAIIKGDQKSVSIAAASIIAKVYRDKIMQTLSKKYKAYGLGRNKGYGTKEHQLAIKKNGLSKIHRASFNLNTFMY